MKHSRVIKFKIWDKTQKSWMNWFEVENNLLFYCQRENLYDVVEFTGLKDAAGREIYEGDIIKTRWVEENLDQRAEITKNLKIIYRAEAAQFVGVGFYEYDVSSFFSHEGNELKEVKIIGNIFESPELLGN